MQLILEILPYHAELPPETWRACMCVSSGILEHYTQAAKQLTVVSQTRGGVASKLHGFSHGSHTMTFDGPDFTRLRYYEFNQQKCFAEYDDHKYYVELTRPYGWLHIKGGGRFDPKNILRDAKITISTMSIDNLYDIINNLQNWIAAIEL